MNKSKKLKNKFVTVLKKNISNKTALLLSLFSLAISTPATAGWEVNFIDKFSGTGVNWDNWTAQTDANFNNEVQCYTDDDSSANKNFDVSNGTLKIIARKQQVTCTDLENQSRSWTSGRINSKDKQEFLYGRIESRIRFHNLESGTWPAFWMLENRIAESPRKNDDDFSHWPDPGAGEIDVWEWFSNNPNTYITNFFNADAGSCGSEVRFTYPNGANDVLNWHDYAIEWDENNISFYMDDTLVTSHNVSNCPQYKEPMFVLLNVAMGGNLGGNIDPTLNKATMEVDYLAHCTSTNQNNATRCNESTPAVFADDDNDGIANDVDQCPNTPEGDVVDNNGCPLDDDNDGIANDIDQCLNTPEAQTVDSDGCSLVQDNIAPEVSLSITQNNVAVSTIDIGDGIVEITADAFDSNIDDILSFSWIMGGAIPSPVINGGVISFDPASMVGGSSHKIEVTVSDNGNPALSATASIQFSIEESQVTQPVDEVIAQPSKISGGAVYVLFWMILLMSSFRYAQRYK